MSTGSGMLGPEALVGREIGGYRLLHMEGTGASSAVFLGERVSAAPDLPERAAIKVLILPWQLKDTERAEFQARFLREIKTLERLRHPHILQVLSAGEQDGLSYMVLPYLSGGTLTAKIAASRGGMPLSQASRYLTQLADALDYAHEQGIIHRDMKPGNVLLDEQDNVYLADFNIARLIESTHTRLTSTGRVMGTPAYMSPEQVLGKPAGHEADIYSLGVVLYEMVTGQVPFEADSIVELAQMQALAVPQRPQLLRFDLPEPAEAVIWQALAKLPGDRFPTAAIFARAFAAGIEGKWDPSVHPIVIPEPVGASPSPDWAAATAPTLPPGQWSSQAEALTPPRGRNLTPWIAAVVLVVLAVLVFNTTNVQALFSLAKGSSTHPASQTGNQLGNGASSTTLLSTQTTVPTETPVPSATASNNGGGQPIAGIPQPTSTPYPTYTPYPTATPLPTATPIPTSTPIPLVAPTLQGPPTNSVFVATLNGGTCNGGPGLIAGVDFYWSTAAPNSDLEFVSGPCGSDTIRLNHVGYAFGCNIGTWSWRVRSVDDAGNTSAWSPTWRFTVVAPTPTPTP